MKSAQAWGWLAAAVLAAGLDAAYHDGGLEWAHRIADQAQHISGAVVALASGQANQFLAEARTLSARSDNDDDRTEFCDGTAPSDTFFAKAREKMDQAQARIEELSARQQAHCARMQAERARVEARLAAHRTLVRIPKVRVETAFRTIQIPDSPTINLPRIEVSQVNAIHCSHIRMSVPALPEISAPASPAVSVTFESESDE